MMKLAFSQSFTSRLSLVFVMVHLVACLFLTSQILAEPPEPPVSPEPPGPSPQPEPFQKVDPRVIQAAQQQESIRVLVYLSRQPGSAVARQEQEAVLPDMEAIESQVRQLTQPFGIRETLSHSVFAWPSEI